LKAKGKVWAKGWNFESESARGTRVKNVSKAVDVRLN
jgi:hypothetical protein